MSYSDKRLAAKYQQYKSAFYIQRKQTTWQMYDELFNVDYNIKGGAYKFAAEMSFTFFHWRLIELISQKKGNKGTV